MADYSRNILRQLATLIRNERKTGANTAKRVGDTLLAFINGTISKLDDDEVAGLITFLGGLLSDSVLSRKFTSGTLGTGFGLFIDNDGNAVLEIDKLLVRMKAIFKELVIEKLSHVGGEVVLTPARMICYKVEIQEDAYRCYFTTTDGDKTITNDFVIGDQARCQTFNIKAGVHQNVSNRFYWRLVIGIGDDYIDLSKTD